MEVIHFQKLHDHDNLTEITLFTFFLLSIQFVQGHPVFCLPGPKMHRQLNYPKMLDFDLVVILK